MTSHINSDNQYDYAALMAAEANDSKENDAIMMLH